MNYQDFRDILYSRKPRYSDRFRPLVEKISIKGDSTGKGGFSTFGGYYQTFMYAYIIGLRLGKKTPFTSDEKKIEFASISIWKPVSIRNFIIMTLFNRTEFFDKFSWDWLSLENCSDESVNNFVTMLIREMEAYANTGFIYLQNKWDNEKFLFSSPFVFVEILEDLPYNNRSSLPSSDNQNE